ncbi:helix-turn-helix domain-containing protein [Paenibacillus sp. NPDC055715]
MYKKSEQYIAMKIINDICNALECDLPDVIRFIPDNNTDELFNNEKTEQE